MQHQLDILLSFIKLEYGTASCSLNITEIAPAHRRRQRSLSGSYYISRGTNKLSPSNSCSEVIWQYYSALRILSARFVISVFGQRSKLEEVKSLTTAVSQYQEQQDSEYLYLFLISLFPEPQTEIPTNSPKSLCKMDQLVEKMPPRELSPSAVTSSIFTGPSLLLHQFSKAGKIAILLAGKMLLQPKCAQQ